jgi:vitamin B12 transporter
MTAYQVDIEDLIEYQSSNSPPYGSYEQGAGTTTSKGVELDFEHALNPQAVIHFATAYTDSKVPDTDGGTKRQVRVPRLQSDLTVHFEPQAGWSLSANVHHVKGVVDGGLDLDDYTLVNLRASYQFEDNLKLYARIDNASDESYETISGYGTLGRNAHIGLTASF